MNKFIAVKISLVLLLVTLLFACSEQAEQTTSDIPIERAARTGDTVLVHFTGSLDDDTVFESTNGESPRGIIIGKQEVLPAFENALIGMHPGESRSLTIKAAQAFGPYRDEAGMKHTVNRSTLTHAITPVVGQQLDAAVFQLGSTVGEHQSVPVTITEVTDTTITVDANHPLAGKDLNFDLTLVKIIAATGEHDKQQ